MKYKSFYNLVKVVYFISVLMFSCKTTNQYLSSEDSQNSVSFEKNGVTYYWISFEKNGVTYWKDPISGVLWTTGVVLEDDSNLLFSYSSAISRCKGLKDQMGAEYDWRIPSITELDMAYENGITSIRNQKGIGNLKNPVFSSDSPTDKILVYYLLSRSQNSFRPTESASVICLATNWTRYTPEDEILTSRIHPTSLMYKKIAYIKDVLTNKNWYFDLKKETTCYNVLSSTKQTLRYPSVDEVKQAIEHNIFYELLILNKDQIKDNKTCIITSECSIGTDVQNFDIKDESCTCITSDGRQRFVPIDNLEAIQICVE